MNGSRAYANAIKETELTLLELQQERNREKFGTITDSNFPTNKDIAQLTTDTWNAAQLAVIGEIKEYAKKEMWPNEDLVGFVKHLTTLEAKLKDV